jgi:hypothetical protein
MTAPYKAKRFNIRHRRRQRRKTQKSSSAKPATATIETDSIEEVVIFRQDHCTPWHCAIYKGIAGMARELILAAQRTVIGLA